MNQVWIEDNKQINVMKEEGRAMNKVMTFRFCKNIMYDSDC